MKKEQKEQRFLEMLDYLPNDMALLLKGLPPSVTEHVTEIRLRVGRPLSLTVKGENLFVSNSCKICFLMQQGLYQVSKNDIECAFRKMCDYSIYAYSNEIKSGFITLKNGCRAGIAASAVYQNGKVTNFNSISSINIRIAGEYIGSATELLPHIKGGIIIAGPPASGKTTLLRDLVRSVSYGINTERKRVSVVDSRGEICASMYGTPQNDVGPLTDVITGTDKAEGILMALRTLSPEVIAFDEISTTVEAEAVLEGVFAGADIFTTLHAGSVQDFLKRSVAIKLINCGAVKNAVFISGVGAAPQVIDINSQVEINSYA